MSWFKRHLNWTLVSIWLGSWLLLSILTMLLTALVPDPVGFRMVINVVYFVVIYCTAGWVLQRKNRSLWWLALFGFGPIVTLCLRNKKLEVGQDN